MSSPPQFIQVTDVAVSLDPAKGSKRLAWGKLRIGPHKYNLICHEDGTLSQAFPNVVELSPDIRITLQYKKSSWLSAQKTHEVDVHDLFTSFSASQTQDLSVAHDGIRVVFSCQTTFPVLSSRHELAETGSSSIHPDESRETLSPTTNAILKDCPRFRILVIGKSGVGKSSLINIAFGIDAACSSHYVRGEANIDVELESPVNERLILHDSVGFESGETSNYNIVKEFIQRRRTGPLEDQLHAIWFCVPTPRAGGRLLEVAAENFFQTKKESLGPIPIIVVYTKLDLAVDEWTMELMPSHPKLDGENLTRLARSKAESIVRKRHEDIDRLAGDSIPYAIISTEEEYKPTFRNLVDLTYSQVGIRDTPHAQTTSGVTLIAAQRVDPNLKIKGTIDVGRQKYWRALSSSPDFMGHTIWECLSVIHTDIVAVWNFNDPARHLSRNGFKELVVKMVQEMESSRVSNPSRKIITLSGSSLVAAISGILGAIANPAAPIVLPVIAGVAVAVWLYDVYRSAKNVQRIFIAYIVDLTHIMETLSILTDREHKKLTRRAIKAAYRAYYGSDLMTQAHASIQDYRDLDGRDAALEMIESLIRPERCGDVTLKDYYVGINKLDLGKFHLDKQEEWSDGSVVLSRDDDALGL